MRRAAAALGAAGNNLIIDDVMFGSAEEVDCRAQFAPYDLKLVGVFALLEVIKAPERTRGDRDIGLARWQFDRVHASRIYDLEVSTHDLLPDHAAERIRAEFGLYAALPPRRTPL